MEGSGFCRFKMRVALQDKEGYYVTLWDKAQRLSVIAKTRAEAMQKAEAILGDADRGRRYVYAFDSVIELQQRHGAQEKP